MGKNYGLTDTEAEIMELLWQSEEPLPFKAIMEVAENKWMKSWKKQTLNTYLTNLQKLGLVGADKNAKHYRYYPLCTKEEHIQRWTQKLVKECFGDSISSLVLAFTGGGKLSKEEAERLKGLL